MSKHAALDTFGRSGNPVIRSSAFDSYATSGSEKMTLDGAVNKTSIMLAVLISTAALSWNFPGPLMSLISFVGIKSVLLKTIPISTSAGEIINFTSFPLCKPKPVASTFLWIVLCLSKKNLKFELKIVIND